MRAPTHVSLTGVLLALAFGVPLLGVMLRMFRVARPVPADAARARRPLDVARLILVPVTGSNHSQRAVESACRLAEEQHAAILLVYMIEVPWTLPLDATLKQADQEARGALEAAGEVAARHRVPVRTVVWRARMAKDGIAAAARDHEADLGLHGPGFAGGTRAPSIGPKGQSITPGLSSVSLPGPEHRQARSSATPLSSVTSSLSRAYGSASRSPGLIRASALHRNLTPGCPRLNAAFTPVRVRSAVARQARTVADGGSCTKGLATH
jgi:hypothetical protein